MRPSALLLLAWCGAGCFSPTDEGGNPQAGNGAITGANGGDSTCPTVTHVDPGNSEQSPTYCICTRRDAVPAGSCPRGLGESVSAMIGPAGGELILKGNQGTASGVAFTITIPPTAIATPTLITVTETSRPPPEGMVDWSPVYRVDPVGLVLAAPATLRVPFSQGRGTSQGNPILFWSGTSTCALERLPSSYVNAGFNQGNVGRLGFAISGIARVGQAMQCQ